MPLWGFVLNSTACICIPLFANKRLLIELKLVIIPQIFSVIKSAIENVRYGSFIGGEFVSIRKNTGKSTFSNYRN